MKKKLFLLGILLFFLQSCGDPDFLQPSDSSQTTTQTHLRISSAMLGGCTDFYEGTKEFVVTIAVDTSTNGDYNSNYYLDNFVIDNAQPNFDYDYEIEVPETGSYTVSVQFDTSDCYVCCSQVYSCDATDHDGNIWMGGGPLFRGIKMLRDQTSVPPEIYIVPNKICF